MRARYHIAIAEVGAQNTWQRIVVGFAIVGSDRIAVERTAADVARFIESTGLARLVRDDHELIAYGAEAFGEGDLDISDEDGQNYADAPWIPESWKSDEDTP